MQTADEFWPARGLYVPVEQRVHALDPFAAAKDPGGQGIQATGELSPGREL